MENFNLKLLLFLGTSFQLAFNVLGTISADENHQANGGAVFDQIIKENKQYNDEFTKDNSGAGLFEADIDMSEEPEGEGGPESSIESKVAKRTLVRAQEYLWVTRVIPYEISPEIGVLSDSYQIANAMRKIEESSCLSFVHRTNEKQWIKFVKGTHCSSAVGRMFWLENSAQTITLSEGCLIPGIIIHEILHALGFWHEQSRVDRDNYVEVMWENIAPSEQYNFAKYSKGQADDSNVNYDINSVMHYGKNAFSRNGKPTILAIKQDAKDMGQRDHMSTEDKIKLNRLYRCEDQGKVYTEWSEWSPCSDNCIKTRQRFCSDRSKCPNVGKFGVETQPEACTDAECNEPVDGHWNRWSSWSDCSKECGTGKTSRTRKCNDPEAKNGGKVCEGKSREEKSCFIVRCGLHPDDCLFDAQRMCYWEDNSGESTFKWKRNDHGTPSGRTGPSSDHTTKDSTKDGFYMYTEASGARTGDTASLVSKEFNAGTRCMTFFYSMHGVTMGSLRVYVIKKGANAETMIWEKIGPQGEDWQEAQVDIESSSNYQIRFEAERGDNYLSDIGLDDIHFRDTKCALDSSPIKGNVELPDPISQICGVRIKAHGCFTDRQTDSTFDNNLLVNQRSEINWRDYQSTLTKLLCSCLTKAKQDNMKYIGMQFYGQCYGSNIPSYNKHGASTACIDKNYNACTQPNSNDVCMGAANANYVYEIL